MKNPLNHISILVFLVVIIFNFIIAPIYSQTDLNSSAEKAVTKQYHLELKNVNETFSFLIVKNLSQLSTVKSRFNKLIGNFPSSVEWKKKSFSTKPEKQANKINLVGFTYAGSRRFTVNGELPNLKTDIKPFNATITGAIGITLTVALHINQNSAWWEGRGRSFYFREDWNNALQADKIGHFMGGYFISYFAREGFVFSGMGWHQSILLGSLAGLLAQTYVEVKDGFADNTGFSPSDFIADALGSGYFYFQHYVPFLQNFTPKWQYAPPGIIGVPPKARTHTFLDNYNSTTAWVSVHVNNLLPESYKPYWPRWLNIAVGYGINGYYTSNMTRRFVVGLDYNLVELLPDGPDFWNWLKQTLNLVKLPAPAIEFSEQGIRFKLLYPFSISVGGNKL